MSNSTARDQLLRNLNRQGLIRVPAVLMRDLIGTESITEWSRFKASWDALPFDDNALHSNDHWRRSLAVFLIGSNFIWRRSLPSQFQDPRHNPLNADVRCGFAPMEDWLTNSVLVNSLLRVARTMISTDGAGRLWYVEMSQCRIAASIKGSNPEIPARPRSDGADWIFVLTAKRAGVTGGISQVYAPDGTEISVFSLKDPLEALLLDNRRCLHGITPIHTRKGVVAGHWDVLIVTFKRTTEWNP